MKNYVPQWLQNRRNRVLQLLSQGYTQTEIALKIGVSDATVSRDVEFITQSVFETKEKWAQELFRLNESTRVGFELVLKRLWEIVDNPKTDERIRVQTFALISSVYDKRVESYANRHIIKRLGEDVDIVFAKEDEVVKREKSLAEREYAIKNHRETTEKHVTPPQQSPTFTTSSPPPFAEPNTYVESEAVEKSAEPTPKPVELSNLFVSLDRPKEPETKSDEPIWDYTERGFKARV